MATTLTLASAWWAILASPFLAAKRVPLDVIREDIEAAATVLRVKDLNIVGEAVVIGDRRKFLTALVGIESDTVGDWATRNAIPYTTYDDLSRKPEVREAIALVTRECEKRGIARAIYAHTPEHVHTYVKEGYQAIGLGTDYILMARAVAEAIKAARG